MRRPPSGLPKPQFTRSSDSGSMTFFQWPEWRLSWVPRPANEESRPTERIRQDEEDEEDEQDGVARHSCSLNKFLKSNHSQSTRSKFASAILSILFIPFILSKNSTARLQSILRAVHVKTFGLDPRPSGSGSLIPLPEIVSFPAVRGKANRERIPERAVRRSCRTLRLPA